MFLGLKQIAIRSQTVKSMKMTEKTNFKLCSFPTKYPLVGKDLQIDVKVYPRFIVRPVAKTQEPGEKNTGKIMPANGKGMLNYANKSLSH